jgi:hypothetical protein
MKSKATTSTSKNLVQAFVRSRHLEMWTLQHELKNIGREEKKFKEFNDRQKVTFMQAIKDRRKDWWKFDSRVRDCMCKEFDNHILNRTKNTVINQYLKPDIDSFLINQIGTLNTPRDNKPTGLVDKSDDLKSKSLTDPSKDDKTNLANIKNPVKLPSIISKLCADTASHDNFDTPNVNGRKTNRSNADEKPVKSQSLDLTADAELIPRLKKLPKIKPNLSKSMSRLEREECMEYIKSSGFSNGEDEAFYDTAHRFLKRSPFYVETKDYVRKCASEDLYKQKCERREKRRANKLISRDHRFENLMDTLKTSNM